MTINIYTRLGKDGQTPALPRLFSRGVTQPRNPPTDYPPAKAGFLYHVDMKRDMDFVRQILLEIEKRNPEASNPGVDVEGRSKDEVYHHLVIMQDRGLVEGVKHTSDSAICVRMTWEGHEFLEQSRDEGIWEQAKDKAISTTGSLSWLAVKTALATIVKAAITGG